MKTKLVYVLTCSIDGTYIEQALMAIYSARYWNPDAWIVLLTDDKTSELIHNPSSRRGEILKYISEEIISTFDPEKNMHYRSRWIKTKVREIVDGDFIFIDCDTICCRPLDGVDNFKCDIGAVLESHLPVADFHLDLKEIIEEKAKLIGWSLKHEDQYFSSGVIYAKDKEIVHKLYHNWHMNWLEGVEKGINIDQPTLGKANCELDHIIKLIPDSYNRILFTQPTDTSKAHILHIASYKNPSFLFETSTLKYIQENGLDNNWLKKIIQEPCRSFRPFDYEILHSSLMQRIKWTISITKDEKDYVKNIGSKCHDKPLTTLFDTSIWMIRKRIHSLRHRDRIKDNVCRV